MGPNGSPRKGPSPLLGQPSPAVTDVPPGKVLLERGSPREDSGGSSLGRGHSSELSHGQDGRSFAKSRDFLKVRATRGYFRPQSPAALFCGAAGTVDLMIHPQD